MEIIKNKKNEDVYAISFWVSFGWMFFGPVVFLLSLTMIMANNDPNFSLDPNYIYSSKFAASSMMTEFIADILPITVIIFLFKRMFIDDFRKFKNNLIKYFVFIVVGMGLILAASALIDWIYSLLGIKGQASNQTLIEAVLSSPMRPIMFIMVVIIAPFMEELIFRKFLIGFLEEKAHLSKWIAFIISALLFAGVHVLGSLDDAIFLPQYLSLSVIITLSYILSKNNLYVSTGIHFLNNLLSFLMV
jgi:membrane protease YdiL (CAAX protease family)